MLSLLRGSHQLVKLHLFADNAMGPETALSQGKPAGGLIASEGQELDVTEAQWRIKLDEVLLMLRHCKKSVNLSISIKKLK